MDADLEKELKYHELVIIARKENSNVQECRRVNYAQKEYTM